MKPLLSSASQLKRTLACPLSEQLPHTATVSEKALAAADKGTALHTYLEHQGAANVYEKVPKKYHNLCMELEKRLDETQGHHIGFPQRELKFVWNWETDEVRVLWNKQHRDYGELGETEISGTADVVIPGTSTFQIWDYKTGQHVRRHLPVNENKQLLFLAYCASRTLFHHATSCIIGIQHIYWTEVKKVMKIKNYAATITAFDLTEFRKQVEESGKFAKFIKTDANPEDLARPGTYCNFCPARPSCKPGDTYARSNRRY